MSHSKNLQDLILTVANEAALPEEQSAVAVTATLRFLTARLPSPMVGQLHELLQTDLIQSPANGNPSTSED